MRRSGGAMDSTRAKDVVSGLDRGTVAVHLAESEASAEAARAYLASSGLDAALEASVGAVLVVVPWPQAQDAVDRLREHALSALPLVGAVSPPRPSGPSNPSSLGEARESGRDAWRPIDVTARGRAGLGDGGAAPVRADDAPRAWQPVVIAPPPDVDAERLEPPSVEPEDEPPFVEPPLPEPAPVPVRLAGLAAVVAVLAILPLVLHATGGLAAVVDALAARRGIEDLGARLVSAGVVHFSIEHLASNAIFALVLATVLAGTHFGGATLAAWTAASVLGIGAEVLASTSGAWVGGASAGNYGLVGLWAHGQLQRSRQAPLGHGLRLRTVGLLLLLVPGALTPFTESGARVAILAHAAGFVVGYGVGFVLPRRLVPDDDPRLGARSRRAGALALGVMLGALAARAWAVFA
jgi:membrane associated rhomboid family serine protease